MIFSFIYLGRIGHFETLFINTLFVVNKYLTNYSTFINTLFIANKYLTSYSTLKFSLIFHGGKIMSRVLGTHSAATCLRGSRMKSI